MCRPWVWIMAIGLVLVGGAWNAAVGIAYDLSKLKTICVRAEDLSTTSKRHFNLSAKEIKNHVYVWLKAKLPRLQIEISTGADKGACSFFLPALWVDVTLDTTETVGGNIRGYYGNVSLKLTRNTRWESGNIGRGIAYSENWILTGPTTSARKQVFQTIDNLLTNFAAEYYKAGNP